MPASSAHVWCPACQVPVRTSSTGNSNTRAALWKHIIDAGHVRCTHCTQNNIFVNAKAFDQHLSEAHPGWVRCPYCIVAVKWDELAKHMERVHPSKSISLSEQKESSLTLLLCTCGEEYCFEQIQDHWTNSSHHPTCPICRVGFPDDFELSHHRLSCRWDPCIEQCCRCGKCRPKYRSAHLPTATVRRKLDYPQSMNTKRSFVVSRSTSMWEATPTQIVTPASISARRKQLLISGTSALTPPPLTHSEKYRAIASVSEPFQPIPVSRPPGFASDLAADAACVQPPRDTSIGVDHQVGMSDADVQFINTPVIAHAPAPSVPVLQPTAVPESVTMKYVNDATASLTLDHGQDLDGFGTPFSLVPLSDRSDELSWLSDLDELDLSVRSPSPVLLPEVASSSSLSSITTFFSSAAVLQCRLCQQSPDSPISTMCGHVFCQGCIVHEFATGNFACPTCQRPILVQLDVTSA